MNFITAMVVSAILSATSIWSTNLEEAKLQSKQEHKLILLSFSGSDWCGPCIKLRRDVFESSEFQDFAKSNLVMVNADFPRLRKNQPGKEQIAQNELLAEKYDPKGIFPFTLLLNSDGAILKSWEGNPGITPAEFIQQIKSR